MSTSLDPKTCKVALLSGGVSGERDISLASGKGAETALKAAGFLVTNLDPANKEDLITLIQGGFDVAFICLHGKQGEDGAIQGFLEVIGLPYIGSNVWASALSMNKAKAKVFYHLAGIQSPQSVVVEKADTKIAASDSKAIIAKLGLPCVVKPTCEGSALGVYIVDGEESLVAALKEAFTIADEILIEQFITGKELTVAVMGNDNPYALPVIEIIPVNEFYDFESKYTPGGSKHLCPAPLDDCITQKAQEMAIEAHRALSCSGVTRSDFLLDEKNELWILETNTIPGMTETSLLPDAGRAAGIEFPELCTRLIEYALKKATC